MLPAVPCSLIEFLSDNDLNTQHSRDSPSTGNRPEQITRLLQESQMLDAVMEEVAQMKRETLRKLNDVRPLTSLLPFELLSHIFHIACPPIDFSRLFEFCESDSDFTHHSSEESQYLNWNGKGRFRFRSRCFPLTLGAVCSRWRKVAWSSPRLWTTFALEVMETKLLNQIPLLRLYLTNAGSLPISLSIDLHKQHERYLENFGDEAAFVELKELEPIAKLIFEEFPSKLQALILQSVPASWMAYLSPIRLPELRVLDFGWGTEADEIPVDLEGGTFRVDPLTQVTYFGNILLESTTSVSRAPLPPLTTLHLHRVHIHLCAKILYYTPHLTDFFCYRSIHSPEPLEQTDYFVPFREPYALPNLKCFGWTALEDRISHDVQTPNIDFLTNIRLPSLEKLQWSGLAEDILNEDLEAMLCFFSNLPTTVHSLSYYEQDAEFFESLEDYVHYQRVLSAIPHIRSLTLTRCSGCFMRSIFCLLSSKSLDTQPKCLLPALERVVIRNPDNYDGEDITVPFVEMVKARRSVLSNHSFSFEAVDCDIEWTRSAQDGIRELSYDFDLNIKERSQEIVFGYFTEREKEIFTSDVDQKIWDPISGWNWVTWSKWQWGSNHQTLNHPWALPSPADISFPWANFNHSSSFTGNAVLPAASTGSSTINPGNNGLENAEWMGTTISLDPDMNFERDFAEWFNHPDDPLDLH